MFCSETGLVRSAHTFRSGFGFGGPTLAARSAAAVGMLGCWDVGIGGYARALMHCTYGGNLYNSNQPGPTVEKTRCEGRGAQNAKAHSATAGRHLVLAKLNVSNAKQHAKYGCISS